MKSWRSNTFSFLRVFIRHKKSGFAPNGAKGGPKMAAKTYLKSKLTICAVLFLLARLTFAAPPRYEIIDLGTLGGRSSVAKAINDMGQVVGWSYKADGFNYAFLWDPINGMIDLGTIP